MNTMVKHTMQMGAIFVICLALFNPQPASADGNIDNTYKYAWSENSGWENFRSAFGGVTVHDAYLSGYAWAENVGWVKLGSGTGPYANTTGTDWGVNHNSTTGALSGYAWSENVGWINFSITANNTDGVSIDPSTLKFSGYAWAENAGYIHFQNVSPEYYVMQEAGVPTVTTQAVTGIGTTTATGNGNITDLSVPDPTAHGVCWNTTGAPTIAGPHKDNGVVSATGAYMADITSLTEGTTYYVKAFATNTAGTAYGDQVSFKTKVVLTMARTPVGGGTTTPAAGSTTNVEADVAQNLTATAETGYHFVNWTANPSEKATFGNASNTTTTVTLTGSATVTANFAINTYTLTTAANPGAGGTVTKNPNQATYDNDSNVQVAAAANANYVFTGWSGDLSGTTNPTSVNMDGNKSVTANFAPTYTVTYNGNGNTGGSAPTDGNAYQQGATVTVLGNTGALVKTGHTFSGWNTAADGGGTSYAPGAQFNMPAANVTLYAQWTANAYTVTFDANGGTDPVPTDKSVTYDEAYGDLAETTRDGDFFTGWFTAATGGTQVTSTTIVGTAENHTLYAQWNHSPYYMAKTDGNWSDAGIWYTNITGGTDPADYTTAATEAPNADNSPGIIVNADVTVDAAVTIDQTTVNADKTLTVDNGVTLTLADGIGTDLTVSGTLTNNGTITCNAGTTADFAGADQTIPGGADVAWHHLTTSATGTKTLGGDAILGGNLTIGAGTTLDLSENNYDLSIDGNWTNNGTFTAREGEVRFGGTAAQTIVGDNAFFILTIDKDDAAQTVDASGSTLAVTNGLSVTMGVFTSASAFKDVIISPFGTLILSEDITVSGEWWNMFGTFTHNNHTVTLNGTDQFIYGSTTFYNLIKQVAAAGTLTFEDGATTTIQNALTFQGAAGQLLSLRSADPGYQWNIDPQGTKDIADVDVQDSKNVNTTAINAGEGSINSNNNENWLFHPIVTTQAVTGIGTTTATGNGNITGLGVPNPTQHGVCWNTTGTPTIAGSKTEEGSASAAGAFTTSMTGLSPNTTYYVRAYATNTAGTAYGNQISFSTSTQTSTVTTQAVTGIGTTTATGNGNITGLGVPNPTQHGVCWNTTGTPTIAGSKTEEGSASAAGAFTTSMTGLSPNTTYYVRAYATNTVGTSYGSQVSFTTNGTAPTLATTTPTSYDCSVKKVEMYNGSTWVTIFSGTAPLNVVPGGTFLGISDLPLPAGTYSQIRVTFTNSFPLKGFGSYGGATYYTTAATFGGQTNLASTPTTVAGSMAEFTFRVDVWGAINAEVTQTFSITPITVGSSTDYQPILRFTLSNKLLLKGTAGTPSTYYFALSAPTVSIVEP